MLFEKDANPVVPRTDRVELTARLMAATVAALGALVLAGWSLDVRALMSGAPGLVAMNPLTAMAFVLGSGALWLSLARFDTGPVRQLAMALAGAVAIIGVLRLIGYVGVDLGIDRLIFSDRLNAERIPNRMAPNTAAAFLLAGLALLGLGSPARRIHVAAQLLALLVLMISMVTLAGYAYEAGGLVQVRDFIPMALNTAIGFASLSVGILCAKPRMGLLAEIIGQDAGSRMARKLLPAVLGIPLLLGWLRLHGESEGLYDSRNGAAIMAASWAVILGAIVWWQARVLNRADAKRTTAEREIAALNYKLRRHATEIEATNRELEAFSYSVSHDLRAPLRSITSFSQALLEDCGDMLDDQGRDYLDRVVRGGQKMAELIEDMMILSRISRSEMQRTPVDLSATALEVANGLAQGQPNREVEVKVKPGLVTNGDPKLLRIMMENLLANAWKFTGPCPDPRIEFGALPGDNGEPVFYVRDNGAGFDMKHAGRLFTPFQRLHSEADFPGTGVGLATVQRVVRRHGGTVWAQSKVSEGATFFFTV
jgi:signal transduction histidine kinase